MDMDNVVAKTLLGEYGWLLIVGFATLVFRQMLQNAVEAFMVFVGNDYNTDDVVFVGSDEKPARIVRVGIRNTTFYMRSSGQWNIKMVIPNEQLKTMIIKKRLPTNGDKGVSTQK